MANQFPFIEQARAKINLTLHVGPIDTDGYHPLKSIVAFADIGDVVELSPAQGKESTLTIEGPFSRGLACDHTNLILKTAQHLSDQKFDFKLTKNLPVSSGIGGGSADAAATARLLMRLQKLDHTDMTSALMDLGADIPVCVRSQTCLMEGKGEQLTNLPDLGPVYAVLVNPGVAVSTGKVFHVFDETPPEGANLQDVLSNSNDLIEMARAGRNDLQDAAISIAPEIQTVLDDLSRAEACQLARMSGSGATCFGLFATHDHAHAAHMRIREKYPDWWCVPTVLGNPA